MDTVAEAPRLLAALLGDESRRLLADGGLGESWAEALASVPPEVLRVPAHLAGLRILSRLRDYWSGVGDLGPALAASRALLQLRASAVGPDHPDTLLEVGALGALVQRAGRVEDGAALLERAYTGLKAQPKHDLRLAVVAANVAKQWLAEHRDDEAERALQEAYELRRLHAPSSAGQAAAQLAEVIERRGRPIDALPLYKEAWALTRQQLGPDHPRTHARGFALGLAYGRLERWEQAVGALRPLHEANRGQAVDEHGATVAFELGIALCRVGQLDEGQRCVEASLRWTRDEERRSQSTHVELPSRLAEWANIQVARGRSEEAEGLLREALEIEQRLSGPDSIDTARRMLELGRFCARRGRTDEALGWIDPAASMHRTLLGDADPATKIAVEVQVELLLQVAAARAAGRDADYALALLGEARAVGGAVLGFAHPQVRAVQRQLERLGG